MIKGLAQSKFLRLLPLDRLIQILARSRQLEAGQHTSETLDKIGSAENIGYFVLPSFVKAGENIWISAIIRRAGAAEIVESAEVQGKPEDLLVMVQDLNSKVRSGFAGLPEDGGGDQQDLAMITTPSLPALGHFVESERLYALDDFKGSIKELEKAVQSDPEYAMAYWKLAENYDYLGNVDLLRENIEKALSLADRVSRRDRFLIEGYAASSLDESSARAIESYKKLLALYPNDETGLAYLGSIYRNIEDWDAAIEQFETIMKINPGHLFAYENLAYCHTAKGRYEKALGILEASVSTFPDVAFFPSQITLIHLIQGRFDAVAEEARTALARSPAAQTQLEFLGYVGQLQGDLESARRIFKQIQKSEDAASQVRSWARLAHVSSLQGRFQQSRDEFRRGAEIARRSNMKSEELELRWQSACLLLRERKFPETAEAMDAILGTFGLAEKSRSRLFPLHLLGMAELGQGRIEDAKRTARRLLRLVDDIGCPKYMRYHHLLMGKIALAEGRVRDAIDELEKAHALLSAQRERTDEHAFFMEALGEGYERNGQPEKAAGIHRQILALTTGRLRWGDIYARSQYRLGCLYQNNKSPAEAISFFEKFLALWKDADPALPEIKDAKERIALLKKVQQP